VRKDERASVLERFIDRYVDTENPGEPRFEALVRTLIDGLPEAGDVDALAELRRDDAAVEAFSIYLRAVDHYGAIITVTEEGDLVLGLELDDRFDEPELLDQAAALMAPLKQEFGAAGGLAGVELPPPQSASEWADDALVMLRDGRV
jgi:hypothetical protein